MMLRVLAVGEVVLHDLVRGLTARPDVKVDLLVPAGAELGRLVREDPECAGVGVFNGLGVSPYGFAVQRAGRCRTAADAVVSPLNRSRLRLIRNAETGWLCRPGDPVALARRIAWLAAHRREPWLREMAESARREVETNFSLDRQVGQFVALLRALSEGEAG